MKFSKELEKIQQQPWLKINKSCFEGKEDQQT